MITYWLGGIVQRPGRHTYAWFGQGYQNSAGSQMGVVRVIAKNKGFFKDLGRVGKLGL